MSQRNKTKNEILQDKAEEWRQETGANAINTAEVAAWLQRAGWQPTLRDQVKAIQAELRTALREQMIKDPQGRRVRQKHPQRIDIEEADGGYRQEVLWHDIREASRPDMQAAFQQRRLGIAMDCRRLKVDVDSYNENWNDSVPIQMVFDFAEDLEEMEHGDDEE